MFNMKKLLLSLMLLIFMLFTFNTNGIVEAVEQVENDTPKEEIYITTTYFGVVVEVDDNDILIYNRITRQLEEYKLIDFYYQESLFMPSIGALVKKTDGLWEVYKTYEVLEYYRGDRNG